MFTILINDCGVFISRIDVSSSPLWFIFRLFPNFHWSEQGWNEFFHTSMCLFAHACISFSSRVDARGGALKFKQSNSPS